MNKTVTINISGIIFHIEEEAYEKLSKYLNTIKGYFSKTDGGNEIMGDIESRIAEMLQSKTSAVKQVVLMADVVYVMDSMGKPEEFMEGEPEANQQTSNSHSNDSSHSEQYSTNGEPIKKRLYRDGDSKVLGGVCSGIGHYFGFDPVWLRIALACLLFFAGTGVLLYIILWIAIPEAKTVSEKFAMKGEKADINNISKAVKEEAEQLKKRMEKYGQEFSSSINNGIPRNAFEKMIDFIGDVIRNVGRVFLKLIAIFMLIIGTIMFFGLFTTVFGLSMADNTNGGDWIDMVLLDGKDFYIGIIGIALCAGIPIVMMIYAGIKILFKINYHNRWVNLVAGIIWLVGLSLCLFVGIRTGSDFNKTAKVRENVTVTSYQTMTLKMHEMPIQSHEISMNDEDSDEDLSSIKKKIKNKLHKNDDNYLLGKRNGNPYLLGHAQLNIIKSSTDKFELVIVKEAKGGEKLTASERAKNITYKVMQTDSLLEFDNLFEVTNADKFRAQDVTVILKVPVGKTIYLDKTLESLIYDIENVTNTYDGDMINRRWIMTESGLKCVDCEGIDENENKNSNNDDGDDTSTGSVTESKDVKITVNGVNINAKDAQVKMDSNGVNINSKGTKVSIDKNGVHIDTKK